MAKRKKDKVASNETLPGEQSGSPSGILLYRTEDGQTHVEVRLEDETVWLSQRMMGELFQKDVRTINEHVQNIYEEGELSPEATIRKFRIVQKVSHEDAVAKALAEYQKYETRQLSVPSPVEQHFLEAVTKVRLLEGDRHQNGTQRDTKRKRSKKKDSH